MLEFDRITFNPNVDGWYLGHQTVYLQQQNL